MDDLQSSDSSAFVFEGEIDNIINDVLEKHLKDKQYHEENVPHWINFICEDIMQNLSLLGKPFKYIVNCVITQNTGVGLHSVISEYLDGFNDGVGVVKWPNDKAKDNTNIQCVVTIFGLAIFSSNQ